MNRNSRIPVVLAIAAAVTIAGCGGGTTAPKATTRTPEAQRSTSTTSTAPIEPTVPVPDSRVPPAPAKSPLPSVEVLDTANGQTVQFANLLPAAKPILFWFWAPH